MTPKATNGSPYNPIVSQLLLLVPARNQNLWAWVIEGNEPAAIPGTELRRISAQSEIVIVNELQRFKCYATQRDYQLRIDKRDRPPQKT